MSDAYKVEPIREVRDIKAIKAMLANNPRNYALFVIGINTSLRGSGRISGVFSAMRRLSGVTLMPCFSSCAISSTSACGSSTTPLPMIESLPSRTTPEGSSDSL